MNVTVNRQPDFSLLLNKLNQNGKKYVHGQESKSLLAIYEHHMFVWHNAGSCVLTTEVTSQINDASSCKVLMPTNPPVFEVDSLLFNRTGRLLALIGRKGIMILEIPWRYGKFWTTSESNFCRSWHIAERFFICSSRVSILHAAWHPGSSPSTHLIVLSSDDYLRLYDVIDSQVPLQVVALGSNPSSSYLSASSKIPFSFCFGENAVSFDFGPPEIVLTSNRTSPAHSSDESIWPIFVLFGNGDVYIVPMELKKSSNQLLKVEGPLAMYPPAEDNYGVDACSVLCLHSSPPVLIIATASGMLYHCLLLENRSNSPLHESVTGDSDIALYVYESVELPLSLTSEETDDAFCHFIRLYKDIGSHYRYHCSHLMGVHSVSVPFLQMIEECSEKDDFQTWLHQLQDNNCIVEHLLCTRPLSSVEAVPVIGLSLTICEKGVTMICLLASWEFACLSLVSFHNSVPNLLLSNVNLQDDVNTAKSIQSESFERHIKHLLCRSTCTPILKSSSLPNNNRNNPQHWLELLTSMTHRLREEYLQPLSTVQAQLESRIKILKQYKEQQKLEVKKLVTEKEELRNGAERLAERYEDARANHQKLEERIEKVLQLLQKKMPVLSSAELNMKQSLQVIEENLKTLNHSLTQIKEKINYQKQKAKDCNGLNEQQIRWTKEDNVNLNETQLKHVKEILLQEGKSITELVRTVEALKIETGL